jgi:NAD(P)-dependent dehydrogenase (short-subunit alcohol dehydrogenase family)
MKDFTNKIVVITGAGSGMGRAYALEFARLGARLALNDYDGNGLAETVKLVRDSSSADLHTAPRSTCRTAQPWTTLPARSKRILALPMW